MGRARRCLPLLATAGAAARAPGPAHHSSAPAPPLLQVPLVDDWGEPMCFSYDNSWGGGNLLSQDMRDPMFNLLHTGGLQDCRVRAAWWVQLGRRMQAQQPGAGRSLALHSTPPHPRLQVAMCEALLAAGFRPTVYPEVQFEAWDKLTYGNMEFLDRQVPLLRSAGLTPTGRSPQARRPRLVTPIAPAAWHCLPRPAA